MEEEIDEHSNNGGDNNEDDESSSDDEDNYDESIILGILERIKNNDPTVTSLELEGLELHTLLLQFDYSINGASDFCKDAGDWIVNNTHLHDLAININSISQGIAAPWDLHIENYHTFLMGVSRNKSITELKLRGFVNKACNSNAIKVLAPLFNNKRICKVSIDDCSGTVLQQLSGVLYDVLSNISSDNPEYTLKELKLHGTNEDATSDNTASTFITTFGDLHCVEKLALDYTTFDEDTSRALSNMLGNPNCVLKELSLQANEITNHWFLKLALENKDTIELLDLCGCDNVSPRGWVNFFNTLRPAKLGSLSTLYLRDNDINDEAAAAFSNVFSNYSRLESLHLSGITSITTSGWQAMAALVRNRDSALCYIKFEDSTSITNSTSFDDDALLAWVNALSISKNATLRSLIIPHEGVTARSWLGLENLVCNKTTIDTLYDSNHTLAYITQDNQGIKEVFPVMKRIVEFQQLSYCSGSENGREVARQKIIEFYFMNGEANMQELINMDLNVMVHAIARIGSRGGWQYVPQTNALLYQLIRSAPSLVDVSRNTKKRNRKI